MTSCRGVPYQTIQSPQAILRRAQRVYDSKNVYFPKTCSCQSPVPYSTCRLVPSSTVAPSRQPMQAGHLAERLIATALHWVCLCRCCCACNIARCANINNPPHPPPKKLKPFWLKGIMLVEQLLPGPPPHLEDFCCAFCFSPSVAQRINSARTWSSNHSNPSPLDNPAQNGGDSNR